MKIKQKKSHKKIIIFAIILFLLIGGATAWIFREDLGLVKKNSRENSEKIEKKEENNNNSPEKETAKTDDQELNVREENPGTPKQFENSGEKTPENQLSGWINFASSEGNSAKIRVTIEQVLASGNCEIILTNSDKSYSETASIVANPGSSSCAGFDIAKEKLSAGNWQIKIRLTSGEKSGEINGEIKI